MSLSCSCDSPYDGESFFWRDQYDTTMPVGIRKRCCSCKDLINISAFATAFPRFRSPLPDAEEAIHDEEVPLANWYLCETCSDLFWSLDALDYCIGLGENMHDLVCDHVEMQENKL